MRINAFKYKKDTFSLENPEPFSLNNGITAICGPVGSGKSTFIKLLSDPELQNVNVLDHYPFPAYLSQDLSRLFSGNTIESLLKIYAAPDTIIGQSFNNNYFYELCEQFNFPINDDPNRPLYRFSEGELQRLAIALTIALERPLALFDEPITALNASYREIFYKLIHQEKLKHKIIFVSHSLNDLRCLADEFVFIHQGLVNQPAPINLLLEKNEYLQYFRP